MLEDQTAQITESFRNISNEEIFERGVRSAYRKTKVARLDEALGDDGGRAYDYLKYLHEKNIGFTVSLPEFNPASEAAEIVMYFNKKGEDAKSYVLRIRKTIIELIAVSERVPALQANRDDEKGFYEILNTITDKAATAHGAEIVFKTLGNPGPTPP